MFFVFVINTGRLIDLEHSDVLTECVSTLKASLASDLNVSEDQLILLAKDGEILSSNRLVAEYGVGTEANPLFVWDETVRSKSDFQREVVSSTTINEDLRNRFEYVSNLPPTLDAVRKRLQITETCALHSSEFTRLIERMLQDQDSQVLGLNAALASIKHMKTQLEEQMSELAELVKKLLAKMATHSKNLESFIPALETLAVLRLPDGVHGNLTDSRRYLAGSRTGNTSMTMSMIVEPFVMPTVGSSLLDYVKAQNSDQSMEAFWAECSAGLLQVDSDFLSANKAMLAEFYRELEQHYDQMAQLVGIEERREALKALSVQASRLASDQSEHAEGMRKNYQALTDARDNSLVKAMADSHNEQIKQVKKNHGKLIEYFMRVRDAKVELCDHVAQRLLWVQKLRERVLTWQNQVFTPALTFLRALTRKLEVVNAICRAPEHYSNAIMEAHRQREFFRRYFELAALLNTKVTEILQAEVGLRRMFSEQIGNHFVASLMPGLCLSVPTIVIPLSPDVKLPPVVTDSDVQLTLMSYPGGKDSQWYRCLCALKESPGLGDFGGNELVLRTDTDQARQDVEMVDARTSQQLRDVQKQLQDTQKQLQGAHKRINDADQESELSKKKMHNDLERSVENVRTLRRQLEEREIQCQRLVEDFERSRVQFDQDAVASSERIRRLEERLSSSERMQQQHLSSLQTVDNSEREFGEKLSEQQQHHNQVFAKLTEESAVALAEMREQSEEALERAKAEFETQLDAQRCTLEQQCEQKLAALREENAIHIAACREECAMPVQRAKSDAGEAWDRVRCLESQLEDVQGKLDSGKKVEKIAIGKLVSKHREEGKEREERWLMEKAVLQSQWDSEKTVMNNSVDGLSEKVSCLSSALTVMEEDRDRLYRQVQECERDMRVLQRESVTGSNSMSDPKLPPGMHSSASSVGDCTTPDVGKLRRERDSYKRKWQDAVRQLESSRLHASDISTIGVTAATDASGGTGATGTAGATVAKVRPAPVKVSLTEASDQDVVVFVFVERHNQYLAVLDERALGHLYFLSEKSHAEFGIDLKGDAPQRPSFVVGQITYREKCESKKPANRFNVPVGTRFYRLCAKRVGGAGT